MVVNTLTEDDDCPGVTFGTVTYMYQSDFVLVDVGYQQHWQTPYMYLLVLSRMRRCHSLVKLIDFSLLCFTQAEFESVIFSAVNPPHSDRTVPNFALRSIPLLFLSIHFSNAMMIFSLHVYPSQERCFPEGND